MRSGNDHEVPDLGEVAEESDVIAHPLDTASERAWLREMTGLIKDLDPVHPVTAGLHTASLFEGNGLRAHEEGNSAR
jgi:hypothetical protein